MPGSAFSWRSSCRMRLDYDEQAYVNKDLAAVRVRPQLTQGVDAPACDPVVKNGIEIG